MFTTWGSWIATELAYVAKMSIDETLLIKRYEANFTVTV